eukprot:COSAG02_NODE_768_length_17375_cov_52.865015_8_plen_50_part_00
MLILISIFTFDKSQCGGGNSMIDGWADGDGAAAVELAAGGGADFCVFFC